MREGRLKAAPVGDERQLWHFSVQVLHFDLVHIEHDARTALHEIAGFLFLG
jgi:hypothetical protein